MSKKEPQFNPARPCICDECFSEAQSIAGTRHRHCRGTWQVPTMELRDRASGVRGAS